MSIGKKVAYLKGLAEGLEISSGSKNGKIITGILDILEDIAELEDYVAEIDDDLCMLEEFVFDDGETEEKDDDDYVCIEDDDDEFDGEKESAENEVLDGVFELKCPHCKKFIMLETKEILESEGMAVECPECGQEIEVIEEESAGHSCHGCGIDHGGE
jgi:endogenous inhibitor of DNA gyrase (YacG/DUF329 family)